MHGFDSKSMACYYHNIYVEKSKQLMAHSSPHMIASDSAHCSYDYLSLCCGGGLEAIIAIELSSNTRKHTVSVKNWNNVHKLSLAIEK